MTCATGYSIGMCTVRAVFLPVHDRLPVMCRHMPTFAGFDNSEAYQGEFEDQEFLSM